MHLKAWMRGSSDYALRCGRTGDESKVAVPFVSRSEILEGKDTGIVSGQALLGIPAARSPALQASVLAKPMACRHIIWGVHLQVSAPQLCNLTLGHQLEALVH